MKFSIPTDVRVTALKTILTKTEKELTFATIANKETFEVLEVKLVLADGQTKADITEGRDYRAVVDYDGTYGSVTLTPVAPAKAKA